MMIASANELNSTLHYFGEHSRYLNGKFAVASKIYSTQNDVVEIIERYDGHNKEHW
jgi:hypothetical protein